MDLHRAAFREAVMCPASAVHLSSLLFIGEANVQGVNVCVRWLVTCEGSFHASPQLTEWSKKCFFVCLFLNKAALQCLSRRG